MRLDGSQWSACLGGDLVEAQLAEEPQGHDFAIWLVELAHGRADSGGALGPQGGDRGIDPARQVDAGQRVGWIDPGYVTALPSSAEGDPDGDPGQPRPERAFAPPRSQASECGHESLLGRILGLVKVAEDPMAGTNDRSRFAVDEDSERVPIAGQNSLDSSAFIDDLDGGNWRER